MKRTLELPDNHNELIDTLVRARASHNEDLVRRIEARMMAIHDETATAMKHFLANFDDRAWEQAWAEEMQRLHNERRQQLSGVEAA